MELVKEINYKKRDWRRDLSIFGIAIGIVLIGVDLWTEEWLAAQWFHLLVAAVLTLTLHELAHGLLFKIWTGRAEFGAGMTKFGPVFYASSPGARLSRNRMLLVALAPQVLTAAYLLVGTFVPFVDAVRIVLVLASVLNFGGGTGDFYCIAQMLKYSKDLQVEDYPMGLRFYMPVEGGSSGVTESVS